LSAEAVCTALLAAGILIVPAAAGAAGADAAPPLATVRVPVANVWEVPGRETIPSDPHVWPTDAVTYSQRLGLVGHMPTQVLYGEQVVVLSRRGPWTRIAVPDQPSPLDRRGYPGWVRSSQLGPVLPRRERSVVVTARTARLGDGTEVGFGTRLPAAGRRGDEIEVETPGGRTRVAARDVAALPRTRADLVRTARLFLGLHYLWGGLSAWGYDCSGLTWAVYRAHGVTIPRDADAQFAAGRPVALEDARPGDLVFYGTSFVHHVAMVVGSGRMIEAPNSASEVRVVPIRTGDLAGARTLLP
jgi:cell wall-associated NlpC family hydrolase